VPAGRGAAYEWLCALQAVAGLGPRRPRRGLWMAVRAAGRRGAGAPPAEARPMNGCARCRPSWGWGPAGRGAAYEW